MKSSLGFLLFVGSGLVLFLTAEWVWSHLANSASVINWLLWSVFACGISSSNAEEVSPDEIKDNSDEQAPHHEGFLGLLSVSKTVNTSIHGIVLVAPLEVAEIPDCEQCERDNGEKHSDPHS